MAKRWMGAVAVLAVLAMAACEREAGDDEQEDVTSDTAAIGGGDTVITTTTTETETDTIRNDPDTADADPTDD